MCLRFGDSKGKDMKIIIRCAAHNRLLHVHSSYTSNGEIVIDVVPCPQCAAQNVQQTSGEPDENYQRFLADVHEREEKSRQ